MLMEFAKIDINKDFVPFAERLLVLDEGETGVLQSWLIGECKVWQGFAPPAFDPPCTDSFVAAERKCSTQCPLWRLAQRYDVTAALLEVVVL